MDNIILNNEDNKGNLKLNLDDLFQYKKRCDLNVLNSYNKVLERAHTRIKTTSRQKNNEQCCWFVVPEVMIGVPKYDVASCIAFVIDKLKENGFILSYTHPNLVFISWKHWIPDYVRSEYKKKTGVAIDGYGNVVDKSKRDSAIDGDDSNPNNLLLKKSDVGKMTISSKKDFRPINNYKPTGNLIYGDELFKKIEDKL